MSQTQMTSPIAKDETIQQTNSLLTQIKNVLTAPIPDYISDAYDNTATYAVGDYCIHENTLYRCITAISSPEEWTAAHWTATTMAAENTEIKSSLSANYVFGNQVNIISYSSSSNMFKAPSDGYILVQTWNNDSPINLWIGANSLSIPITNTTLKAFALFAKKGTSYWIGRTGTNNSAMFLPLVMEQ